MGVGLTPQPHRTLSPRGRGVPMLHLGGEGSQVLGVLEVEPIGVGERPRWLPSVCPRGGRAGSAQGWFGPGGRVASHPAGASGALGRLGAQRGHHPARPMPAHERALTEGRGLGPVPQPPAPARLLLAAPTA